jgi:menaquinone-specific isochorismate synthase
MAVAVETGSLLEDLGDAIERARDRGASLASATVRLDEPVDPSALVLGARLASDRWFCWEQPERKGFALAGLGTAMDLVSRGPDRFRDVSRGCAESMRDRVSVEREGLPAAAGPVWTAGFAFDPEGGSEAKWSSLPPALAVMPELSLVRSGGEAFLTACVRVTPDVDAAAAIESLSSRLGSLRPAAMTPADPHPSGRFAVSGRHAPERYEEIVAMAVERIRAGVVDKVVLARELAVEAPAAYEVTGLFGTLRDLFPSCFCFCFGTPEAAFVGASPELLVRRSGAVAATVALAGTTSRSADPAVDAHLGEAMVRSPKVREEHRIVVRRIERSLRPLAVWVHAEDEPEPVRVGNLQHLATPIRAQLAEARGAIELAGLLHPTPAVGGEPREEALRLVSELEGIDRGWYAAPVGWMDAVEDGEFCVGLRSALLRDRHAHLFAGCGIVADSDPAAELQESELKFEALLPLLAP